MHIGPVWSVNNEDKEGEAAASVRWKHGEKLEVLQIPQRNVCVDVLPWFHQQTRDHIAKEPDHNLTSCFSVTSWNSAPCFNLISYLHYVNQSL